MEQDQMSSETSSWFSHFDQMFMKYGELVVQRRTVISWRFVLCRFKIAPGHPSFYYERLPGDYTSVSTSNKYDLNADQICLTSCLSSDKLSTEHKKRETHAK